MIFSLISLVGTVTMSIDIEPLVELDRPSLEVTVTTTNYTSEQVLVMSADFWCNHKVIVRDQNGVELKMSQLGKNHRGRFGSKERTKNIHIFLKPGKTYTANSPEFQDDFVWKKGKFSVEVFYSDYGIVGELNLRSQIAMIEVR